MMLHNWIFQTVFVYARTRTHANTPKKREKKEQKLYIMVTSHRMRIVRCYRGNFLCSRASKINEPNSSVSETNIREIKTNWIEQGKCHWMEFVFPLTEWIILIYCFVSISFLSFASCQMDLQRQFIQSFLASNYVVERKREEKKQRNNLNV